MSGGSRLLLTMIDVTVLQYNRKVHGFMAAMEVRVIRLRAHSRWEHECVRRLTLDRRVQAAREQIWADSSVEQTDASTAPVR